MNFIEYLKENAERENGIIIKNMSFEENGDTGYAICMTKE